VDSLIEVLADEDATVREYVADALDEIKGEAE
jgi:HEAT repeat protein